MKIAFLGDIILNGNYIHDWHNKQNPFSDITPYLDGFDFVVGNLECFVSGDNGNNPLRNKILQTEPETLGFLKSLHVDVVTLANNHVYDHRVSGFSKTTRLLDKYGIKWFGASTLRKDHYKPIVLEKDGVKVGLLNYVSEDTNPNLPENSDLYVNILKAEQILNDINLISNEVDYLVLILHWGGNVEYSLYPDVQQVLLADFLADSNVDLIIGHHSHTIQPMYQAKNTTVYFSLGNFCYDGKIKYGHRADKVRAGAVVECDFSPKGILTNRKIIHNVGRHLSLTKNDPGFINTPQRLLSSQNILNKLKLRNQLHFYFERSVNRISNFFGKLMDSKR
ncbi:MAG: CapA family protein [Flavobacteriaceae bacterium]|nr:CapA family protein [Flavobacteriaceae bacterium]